MHKISNAVWGGLSGVAAHVAGLDWELLFVWCLLMGLDIITGYVKAWKCGVNTSNAMRAGLYKKLQDTFSVVAVLLMQEAVIYLGINIPAGSVLLGAFCFKEMTSILENTSGTNSALPKTVQKWIKAVQIALNDEDAEMQKAPMQKGDNA